MTRSLDQRFARMREMEETILKLRNMIKQLKSEREIAKLAIEKKAIDEILLKKRLLVQMPHEYLIWPRLKNPANYSVRTIVQKIRNPKKLPTIGAPWLHEKPIRVIDKWAFDQLLEKLE